MRKPTHASIRGDLYKAEQRIIGKRVRDGQEKAREPLYWQNIGSFRNTYTLLDPFGDLWQFDSADLDFHHVKPEVTT